MPKFPLPELPTPPDLGAPLKLLRKIVKGAKDGMEALKHDVRDLADELHGEEKKQP